MPLKLVILSLVTAINLVVLAVVVAINGGQDAPPAADHSGDIRPALGLAASTPAPQPAVVTDDGFKSQLQPFLAKYCIECHGPQKQRGGLTLHEYGDKASIARAKRTWITVAEMIQSGEMPSGKGAKPTLQEREEIVAWIEKAAYNLDPTRRDPGRVTLRRLNRAEYNNTVRDLLAVDFNPADDFPSDDVGYGFDNIGDVLSLPPVLLEKYLRAAEKVAAAAVTNDPGLRNTNVRRVDARAMEGGTSGDRRTRMLTDNGDISAAVEFPKDGQYEFKINAYGHQAGDEPVRMGLLVDSEKLFVFEVKNDETRSQDYTLKASVKKGNRKVIMRFLNDFYDPNGADAKRRDRNLIVRSIEVTGPIQAQPDVIAATQIFSRRPNADGSDWKECATEILSRLARRAYRRPASSQEVERLVKLVELVRASGDSFEKGIEVAITAVLVSPHFLYRVEQDPDPKKPDAVRILNDHELASRLSYFIWSSMPDEELFKLADRGVLRQPEILQQQIRSMLKDPRAGALVKNFAGQWLQLRSLERITPDSKSFPDFDAELRRSMLRETELFVESVIREDRSVLDFIDGRYTFVNARLAKHYGLSDVGGFTGDEFKRIDLDGSQRSGILTQASILTITSNPTRTSPVLRGKFVLEEILGTPPPPAPADVPELPDAKGGPLQGTLRQRMEQHRVNPLCASCHERMDPIGFGLENFDGIGRWRTSDNNLPVEAGGTLSTGETFKTPAELKVILLGKKRQFVRSLSEKMLTFALGRGLEYYDKPTVEDVVRAVEKNDYRFSALVVAIVQSDAFQKRRGKRADE